MCIYRELYFYLLSYVQFRWLTFLQITYLSNCQLYYFQALLVTVRIKDQLDVAKLFPLCGRQLC